MPAFLSLVAVSPVGHLTPPFLLNDAWTLDLDTTVTMSFHIAVATLCFPDGHINLRLVASIGAAMATTNYIPADNRPLASQSHIHDPAHGSSSLIRGGLRRFPPYV